MRAVLKAGGNINDRDAGGYVPLHYAAATNRGEIITELLLKREIKINIPAKNDITALHLAVHHGNAIAVELLLQHGAEITEKVIIAANNFETDEDEEQQNKTNIIKLLEKYRKKIPEEPKKSTPTTIVTTIIGTTNSTPISLPVITPPSVVPVDSDKTKAQKIADKHKKQREKEKQRKKHGHKGLLVQTPSGRKKPPKAATVPISAGTNAENIHLLPKDETQTNDTKSTIIPLPQEARAENIPPLPKDETPQDGIKKSTANESKPDKTTTPAASKKVKKVRDRRIKIKVKPSADSPSTPTSVTSTTPPSESKATVSDAEALLPLSVDSSICAPDSISPTSSSDEIKNPNQENPSLLNSGADASEPGAPKSIASPSFIKASGETIESKDSPADAILLPTSSAAKNVQSLFSMEHDSLPPMPLGGLTEQALHIKQRLAEKKDESDITKFVVIPKDKHLPITDSDAIAICNALYNAKPGEEHLVGIIGGEPRDRLAKITPKDSDIIADWNPSEIYKILQGAVLNGKLLSCAITGIAYPIVLVTMGEKTFQVATFRKARHVLAGRRFIKDLLLEDKAFCEPLKVAKLSDEIIFKIVGDDISNRDLTYNTAFVQYRDDGYRTLITPQALTDHSNNLARCVGNPVANFSTDPIRMLRDANFIARFRSEVDPKTDEAFLVCAHKLLQANDGRIIGEINKVLEFDRDQLSYWLEFVEQKGLLSYLRAKNEGH